MMLGNRKTTKVFGDTLRISQQTSQRTNRYPSMIPQPKHFPKSVRYLCAQILL